MLPLPPPAAPGYRARRSRDWHPASPPWDPWHAQADVPPVEGGLRQLVNEAVELGSRHAQNRTIGEGGPAKIIRPKGAVGVPTRSRAGGPIGSGPPSHPQKMQVSSTSTAASKGSMEGLGATRS